MLGAQGGVCPSTYMGERGISQVRINLRRNRLSSKKEVTKIPPQLEAYKGLTYESRGAKRNAGNGSRSYTLKKAPMWDFHREERIQSKEQRPLWTSGIRDVGIVTL